MDDFDNLKNDVEHEAQQHPQQVKEGAQDIEKKLGVDQQGTGQQDQSGQNAGSSQGNDQSSGGQGQ